LALAATTPATLQARAPLASALPAPPASQASAAPRVAMPAGAQPGNAAPAVAARTAAPIPIAVSPPPAARAEQLYQQALAASQQGQPELALKSLREALESQSGHVPARLALARLLVDKKQATAAADLLADGLMLLPQQASFALALAPLWLQSGRQDEAMGLLAQSVKSAGNSPDYHGYYAAQLLQLKRHADAVKHYSIALGSNPGMVDWLIGLGLSLQGTRNDKEALEAFKRAYDTGSLTGQKRELVEQMITGLKARLGP
jgi:MSHA biogenesis protein MshN